MDNSRRIAPFPDVPNIHPIVIPLPSDTPLLTVNLYAVGKGPVTLIDTGPKFSHAVEFVGNQLRAIGLSFADVERIVATHGHVDHTGSVTLFRAAAEHPVEFYIHPDDSWLVTERHRSEGMWGDEARRLAAWAGIPEDVVVRIRRRFSFFKSLSDPIEDIRFCDDGAEFFGDGYRLQVIHTPGHTAGSLCLYEREQGILLSGDTIIKHITPNPILEMSKSRLRNPGYRSLPSFLRSLDKIATLDVRYVFPGHGEYVDDVRALVDGYKEHHRQRMNVVLQALRKKPRPLYDLMQDVFPIVPEADVFLAVSEIMVHLEVLLEDGRARLLQPGPPALYGAA